MKWQAAWKARFRFLDSDVELAIAEMVARRFRGITQAEMTSAVVAMSDAHRGSVDDLMAELYRQRRSADSGAGPVEVTRDERAAMLAAPTRHDRRCAAMRTRDYAAAMDLAECMPGGVASEDESRGWSCVMFGATRAQAGDPPGDDSGFATVSRAMAGGAQSAGQLAEKIGRSEEWCRGAIDAMRSVENRYGIKIKRRTNE